MYGSSELCIMEFVIHLVIQLSWPIRPCTLNSDHHDALNCLSTVHINNTAFKYSGIIILWSFQGSVTNRFHKEALSCAYPLETRKISTKASNISFTSWGPSLWTHSFTGQFAKWPVVHVTLCSCLVMERWLLWAPTTEVSWAMTVLWTVSALSMSLTWLEFALWPVEIATVLLLMVSIWGGSRILWSGAWICER